MKASLFIILTLMISACGNPDGRGRIGRVGDGEDEGNRRNFEGIRSSNAYKSFVAATNATSVSDIKTPPVGSKIKHDVEYVLGRRVHTFKVKVNGKEAECKYLYDKELVTERLVEVKDGVFVINVRKQKTLLHYVGFSDVALEKKCDNSKNKTSSTDTVNTFSVIPSDNYMSFNKFVENEIMEIFSACETGGELSFGNCNYFQMARFQNRDDFTYDTPLFELAFAAGISESDAFTYTITLSSQMTHSVTFPGIHYFEGSVLSKKALTSVLQDVVSLKTEFVSK